MIELRKYVRSLQEAIGKEYSPKKKSADSIDESHWLELVVKELNKMSGDRKIPKASPNIQMANPWNKHPQLGCYL